MRRYIFYGLIFQLIFLSQTLAQTLSEKWTEKAQNSVVFIEIPVTNQENGGIDTIKGTGFIISKDGFLLTAQHILKRWREQSSSQKEENVIFGSVGGNTSTERYPLELVDEMDSKDVALMKLRSPRKDFQQLPLCFDSMISRGSSFVALGYPLGEDLQPTDGIFGNKNGPGGRWAVTSEFTYGMSGGPVFNKSGVIGIVKGGVPGEPAVSWVTPVSFAKTLAEAAPGYLKCDAKVSLQAMVLAPVKPTSREHINLALEWAVSTSLLSSFTKYRSALPEVKGHMAILSSEHLSETERKELSSGVGCQASDYSAQIWTKVKYVTTIAYSNSTQGNWKLHLEIFKFDGACELAISADPDYNDQNGWKADATTEYLLKELGILPEKEQKVLLFPPIECKGCPENFNLEGEAFTPATLSLLVAESLEQNISSFNSLKNIKIKNLDDQDRLLAIGEDLTWFADHYKAATHFLPGKIKLIDFKKKQILIDLELHKKPITKDFLTTGSLTLPASRKELIILLHELDVLPVCCTNLAELLGK